MWTLFRVEKRCSECLVSPFPYYLKLLIKLGTALLIEPAENCSVSSPVRLLNPETVLGSGWRFQSTFVRRSPDMISLWYLNLESYWVANVCSFSIICGQFSQRHFWVTCEMRTVPHVSCWICHSLCQQSVALFNELWKYKLINNYNYCLHQYYHWSYVTV